MPGVTKEQIQAAKRMTALEYLQRYQSDRLAPCCGSSREFQLVDHDSFKISGDTSLWHWKSRDIGGRTALDFLIYVEGMRFVDAVLELCEETSRGASARTQAEQKPLFTLPPAAGNNRRVFAYLLKRGIDRQVIEACTRSEILYESANYHNAVFVGRDESGEARYAFLRGTYTGSEKPFKAEAAGSDKTFCFCVPPAVSTKRVAVYEAAIDALAHWTLEGITDKYRLSLGGIYAPKDGEPTQRFKAPAALSAFFTRHPEMEELEICTDNDPAGRWAAEHIEKTYQGQYRVIQNLPARDGYDYGDLAEDRMRDRAARQKAALSR